MFARIACCVGLVALLFPLISKAQDKISLFGGYSFVRAPIVATEAGGGCVGNTCITVLVGTRVNLNGWEFSGTYMTNHWLGIAADFSGHYASAFAQNPVHLHTFLFGPQVSLPVPVSPFVHVLIGAAHESVGSSSILQVSGCAQTSFASAFGGGIDIKLLPFLSVRPVQIDYLLTGFNSRTQNQPRLSAGVVLHF
jgi:hypothetical protein